MKGVVFNLLAETVSNAHGEEAWDGLLAAAGLDGAYTSLGSYPDEQMFSLVAVAAEVLGISRNEVLRWFGRSAMPMLATRYGVFFEGHRSARSFLFSVNDIIHPEVRKLYVGAACPYIDLHEEDDGTLMVGYRSARRMCGLAHGFMEGAAAHYGETIVVEHRQCTDNGDARCMMAVAWS